MNRIFLKILIALIFCAALSGCARLGLAPPFETPAVSVNSFRMVPSDRSVPQFEIGLRIANPNRVALNLAGLSYSVSIEGHKVLTGVASELPTVPAYGEEDILLLASPDLLSSVNLFSSLLQSRRETLAYELNAKLDVGRLRLPIPVAKKGELSLRGFK